MEGALVAGSSDPSCERVCLTRCDRRDLSIHLLSHEPVPKYIQQRLSSLSIDAIDFDAQESRVKRWKIYLFGRVGRLMRSNCDRIDNGEIGLLYRYGLVG